MIIVKLMGGLGNQMFEYACGRALSIRKNTSIKLDLSYLNRVWLERLKGNPIRRYSLGVFNIKEELAKEGELPPLGWLPGTRFGKIISRMGQHLNPHAPIILREVPFQPKINEMNLRKANKDVYLDGYWQNEAYFKEIGEVLRREFSPRRELSPESQKLAHIIKNTNSVSLHIRREDYVTHPAHSLFLGALSLDYYQRATTFLTQKISRPHFFILGDDLAWARQNLKINHPVIFVEHNLGTDHYFEDMFLMSLCQHNIVANSSFSWWGTWLNRNPQKIVIAPKKWFRAREWDGGVVPKEWMRL